MIAELKKSKEQIQQDNQTLDQRVKDRTKELQAAQLQMVQSDKLASIGQLAASISHELSNPLSSVLGFSQYILEEMRKKRAEEITHEDFDIYIKRLSQIERAAQRCKSIIENLLTFARTSGTEIKPLDINHVIEDTLVFTKYQLEMKKIHLEKNFSPTLSMINGNQHQLQQVFTNLIINAEQAMENGGKLTISTMPTNNGYVEVHFSDTGAGIAPENLKKIFEPFFTTKPVGEGTGLGLSVSYKIIQDMGGDIAVESKVGRGTVFKVRLHVTA